MRRLRVRRGSTGPRRRGVGATWLALALVVVAALGTGLALGAGRGDRGPGTPGQPAVARTTASVPARSGGQRAPSEPRVPPSAVPVVQQKLRNGCEAAALSILLDALGRPVDQLAVQRTFRRSGPADPVGGVWGDPDRGFVGRAAGGGVAGGFGVYPGPVAAAARRLGQRLRDLTGEPVAKVYDELRAGNPVMVWVGLSDGPYGSWTSPAGRAIRVNFGEHTVVLAGLTRSGRIIVSNPLHGTRDIWSRMTFEGRWKLLGHRALAR